MYPVSVEATPQPHSEDIARLAYALWQERGEAEGTAEEDWRRAEDTLRNGHPRGY